MSLLGDMLGAIAERGRAILDLSAISQSASPVEQIVALCERLLSSRGEASALAAGSEILARYAGFDEGARLAFFSALRGGFGPEVDALLPAARAFVADPGQASAEALHQLSEPRRQKLFRLLNQSAPGTRRLIEMRADLLRLLREHTELEPVDRDFRHLFRSWFNRGFLELRRIDWNAPAAVLERIIRYEAVHEIADWDDLRRRIDPPDRRLYAFFHPRLRDEPLIFVEIALTHSMASSIQSILDPHRGLSNVATANTAMFYSISDCQPGLRGVSFGNFLIKQVVEELRAELPQVTRFATLSPLPSFSRWLGGRLADLPTLSGLADLSAGERWRDRSAAAPFDPDLTALAAFYLSRARDRSGRLADPVARFHLGNGARLERINWLANTGPQGIAASYGMMVNYVYKLDEIERNHERFASGQEVAVSAAVRRQANAGAKLLELSAGYDRAVGGT